MSPINKWDRPPGLSIRAKLGLVFLLQAAALQTAEPPFLRRSLPSTQPEPIAAGASYKPLFENLKAVIRYGELTVDPGASTPVVAYPGEEQICFVTEGNATLIYQGAEVFIRKDDFFYLAPNAKHGITNLSAAPVRVIIMGYRVSTNRTIAPQVPLANADDVPLQILGQHGPTTQFKLLMGSNTSTRDKLAAATIMNSLFLMDFAPGGTNIPHNHPREEEIYLLLRGSGEMVAGRDADGKDVRHPVSAGDAFYFAPGTQVGYYSHAREGESHDLILAVRSGLPTAR